MTDICSFCEKPKAYATCASCKQQMCYEHFTMHLQMGHKQYSFSTPHLPEILKIPCCILCGNMKMNELICDLCDDIPVLCRQCA